MFLQGHASGIHAMIRYLHYAALVLVVTAFCGVMSLALAASAGETSVSLGAEYTSGDYGTSSNTKMWYFPVTLRYETDRYMMALIVPYLFIEGSGNVVASGGRHGTPRPNPNPTTQGTQTNSGLGDIELVASHVIAQSEAGWRVSLGGYIKFGTADEQDNLGTGENDYSVQLAADRTYGNNTLFGTAGYKVLGDMPGVDYDNVFFGSVGVSHRLDATRSAGVELYMEQAPLPGVDGQSELTIFLSSKLEAKTRLTGYVVTGFADGSPDWGLGVALKMSQ
jgi:hypothetical protein